MFFVVGNDIGNSETKMFIGENYLKQPSVIKRLFNVPNVTENDLEKNIHNLQDQLLVNITSKAIKRNGLFFVGKRANQQADQAENMNIILGNKSSNDVPVVTTLAMLAAHAVQLTYKESKELRKTLTVNTYMTSAIPASEYTLAKAKYLEDRFTNNEHIVIVYVGDSLVTVKITFEKVKVTQEGIPALFALLESDKGILENYNKEYKKNAQPVDFKDKKILHVDIGDGTTEYIYTVGVNPVSDVCSGERRGVGHATQEAIKMLYDATGGMVNLNRQQFMAAFRDTSHVQHEKVKQLMAEARFTQAQKILEDIQEKYMNNAAGNVDLICVYGGGSIQFRPDLYADVLNFARMVGCELLWIPEKYAVDMNVRGMQILNKNVLFRGVEQ